LYILTSEGGGAIPGRTRENRGHAPGCFMVGILPQQSAHDLFIGVVFSALKTSSSGGKTSCACPLPSHKRTELLKIGLLQLFRHILLPVLCIVTFIVIVILTIECIGHGYTSRSPLKHRDACPISRTRLTGHLYPTTPPLPRCLIPRRFQTSAGAYLPERPQASSWAEPVTGSSRMPDAGAKKGRQNRTPHGSSGPSDHHRDR